ncbi:MAG: ATP-binding protein [Pseudomonadota bacterium]
MSSAPSTTPQSRPLRIAMAAFVLLVVTVVLGATLGWQTRDQFREVEAAWRDYAGGAERKGILISELRGHLGYGGIIHNFKNYVLRRDPRYLTETQTRLAQYKTVMTAFDALSLTEAEARALATISATVDAYEANLETSIRAAERGLRADEIDQLVRIDDTAALRALGELEASWQAAQQASTARLVAAVAEGKNLIWIGFLSLTALVLVALTIGTLLYMLIHGLRRAVRQLARELAERQRLERSEGRLATAVEQSPTTILITDTAAKIQYVNAKFEALTGWSREEVLGQTPAFLQSGDTADATYHEIRNALAAGDSWHGVFRNRKKDGSSYWSETTILPLIGPDGAPQNFIGIGEDITEKRKTRDQVVRAQKLEAVGQLAGGVAHDFNNILTTIVGATHLATLDAQEGSDLAAELGQIDIAARRAQNLVQELLTFARREPGQAKPVVVQDIIGEVTHLLRASVPPSVTIIAEETDAPLSVMGDPTHLHQILMNLCRNAAEALGGRSGTIRVALAECAAPLGSKPWNDGWVRLDVSDDGPGMSNETASRLFEPFFTTKPIGKGSGLGLSVVYGLVEEMGGQVTVESAPGEGATFSVFMPATQTTRTTTEAPEAPPLPRGTERLILIDDEAEVAGIFRRLLLRLGYRVEAFTSPIVALERFRADPDRYDLVIADMVMPELSGEDLISRFRDLRPKIPVIFVTGYKPRQIVLAGPKPDLLDKPVDPARLARHVRAYLDQPTD